jgi:hypothetical protein
MIDKCENFERGLGILLRNAWTHSEALLTTDLPALMHYICDVLETISEQSSQVTTLFRSGDVSQKQEFLVFIYLANVMKNIDNVPEETLMGIAKSRRLFMLGVSVLLTTHIHLQKTQMLRMGEALSLVAESENFSTYFSEYIRGRSDAEELQSLKVACLGQFSSDMEARRCLRPLNDCVDKALRKYRKK